jgi:hypothetical protein
MAPHRLLSRPYMARDPCLSTHIQPLTQGTRETRLVNRRERKERVETMNDGICDWCLWPIGRRKPSRTAQGTFHTWCVSHAKRRAPADAAKAGLADLLDAERDLLHDFLVALGREAAMLNIDRQRLAKAVERAVEEVEPVVAR